MSFAKEVNQQPINAKNVPNTYQQLEKEETGPIFYVEKEIYEIKLNFAKFINEQQNHWINLEKMVKNNADSIELLTNSIRNRNG